RPFQLFLTRQWWSRDRNEHDNKRREISGQEILIGFGGICAGEWNANARKDGGKAKAPAFRGWRNAGASGTRAGRGLASGSAAFPLLCFVLLFLGALRLLALGFLLLLLLLPLLFLFLPGLLLLLALLRLALTRRRIIGAAFGTRHLAVVLVPRLV